MLRAENSYKLYTNEENIPYWNREEIASQMPHVYSIGRNKTNGNRVVKQRNFPGYVKMRGATPVLDAFIYQDKVRRDWRKIEEAGELPHLYMTCPFGEVRLNQELAEYFLETSEIAELHVRGWRFTAK